MDNLHNVQDAREHNFYIKTHVLAVAPQDYLVKEVNVWVAAHLAKFVMINQISAQNVILNQQLLIY